MISFYYHMNYMFRLIAFTSRIMMTLLLSMHFLYL